LTDGETIIQTARSATNIAAIKTMHFLLMP
jgi:hypothetical protein